MAIHEKWMCELLELNAEYFNKVIVLSKEDGSAQHMHFPGTDAWEAFKLMLLESPDDLVDGLVIRKADEDPEEKD